MRWKGGKTLRNYILESVRCQADTAPVLPGPQLAPVTVLMDLPAGTGPRAPEAGACVLPLTLPTLNGVKNG